MLAAGCGGTTAATRTCRAEPLRLPGPRQGILEGVAVAPNGDAFAVGSTNGDNPRPLAFRIHDGKPTRTPTPVDTSADALNDLRAVAAPGDDAAWAVGANLVLRWDGRRWRRERAPAGSYWGVSASSAKDVWAVGTAWNGGGFVVSHFDGTSWRRVPFLPIPSATTTAAQGRALVLFSHLEAVLARGPDDVWAVGGGTGAVPALAAHWDGTRWRRFDVPDSRFLVLFWIAALPDGTLWTGDGHFGYWKWSRGAWRKLHARPVPERVAARRSDVLALHDGNRLARWDGSRWLPLARAVDGFNAEAFAAGSIGDVWAAGDGAGDHFELVRYRCTS